MKKNVRENNCGEAACLRTEEQSLLPVRNDVRLDVRSSGPPPSVSAIMSHVVSHEIRDVASFSESYMSLQMAHCGASRERSGCVLPSWRNPDLAASVVPTTRSWAIHAARTFDMAISFMAWCCFGLVVA